MLSLLDENRKMILRLRIRRDIAAYQSGVESDKFKRINDCYEHAIKRQSRRLEKQYGDAIEETTILSQRRYQRNTPRRARVGD